MTFPDEEEFLTGGQQPPEKPKKQTGYSPWEEPESSLFPGDEDRQPIPPQKGESPDFNFPRMEDDVAEFRRELDELQFRPVMRIRDDEPVSTTFSARGQAARRRRRAPHLVQRLEWGELGDRLESIAQSTSPTFDFFVFSLICGLILGIGYILDAPAILIIGILTAPLLAPLVGVALSAATGEASFFGQTLGGILTALALVFGVSILAGLLSRILQPLTLSQAFYHARLWWPDLFMLVIGTVILVIAFIQSEEKPVIASLMVAYEIYLPAGAAGFGIGSGVKGLWPEAGLVFLVHMALALIISLIVLFYMGFRPLEVSGYALTAGIVLVGLVILAGFAGVGSLINVRGDQSTPAAGVMYTQTPRVTAIINPASTMQPNPELSKTPTPTLVTPPSPTRAVATATIDTTPSPTLLPTPVYGRVESNSGGILIRVKPGGQSITTVQNGYLVEILGDKPVVLDGAVWIHVIIKTPTRDLDGWVLQNLITTATPSGAP